jgi:uncharacterized membrane protein YhaH (DUF805 family)
MYLLSPPIPDARRPHSGIGHLLWSPQGVASRRQWWLGHISAALLAALGLIGATGVVIAMAGELGIEEGGLTFELLLDVVALTCLLHVAAASNALCRRRLRERGEPNDLADIFAFAAGLEAALMLVRFVNRMAASAWSLPAIPPWLASAVAFLFLVSLLALVLECGVLEEWSLTELWRGKARPRSAMG